MKTQRIICALLLAALFVCSVVSPAFAAGEPSAAAQEVIEMIISLDENTSPDQLAAIRAAYNSLSDEDKEAVWNSEDIFTFEKKYADALNDDIKNVDPLEIDLYAGARTVNNLKARYNVLGDEAKALVTEYPKLEELAAKIDSLRAWNDNKNVMILNSTLNGFSKYDLDDMFEYASTKCEGIYYYFDEVGLLEPGDNISTGYYDIDPFNEKVRNYKYAKLEMDIKFTDLDFTLGWPSFRTLVENVENNVWTGFDFVNNVYFSADITKWGQGGFCNYSSTENGNIDLGVWHHWVIIWDEENVTYEMDGETVYETKYEGGYEFLIIYPWNCNLEMTNVLFIERSGKVTLSPFRNAHNVPNWVRSSNDEGSTMLDLVEESVAIARDAYNAMSDAEKEQITGADQIERVQQLIDIVRSGKNPVTVTDGSADVELAAEGDTVTITANEAPEGMIFDKWEVVSGEIALSSETAATATFTMPATAVAVKATFKEKPDFIPGDANGDEKINSKDVTAVMKAVVGVIVKNYNVAAADFDGNGKVNSKDVIAIMKYIVTH